MKFSLAHVFAVLAFVAHLGSSAPVHFGVSQLFAQSEVAPKARKCCCCCQKAAAPTNHKTPGNGWRAAPMTPAHDDSCPIPGGCAACNVAKTVGMPASVDHVAPNVALETLVSIDHFTFAPPISDGQDRPPRSPSL